MNTANNFSCREQEELNKLIPPAYESNRQLSEEEVDLKHNHDRICQTCDGCSKTRCAFTEGYRRRQKEASGESLEDRSERDTSDQLIRILMAHVGQRGDNEGAVECLSRIIMERDMLLRREVNRIFGK